MEIVKKIQQFISYWYVRYLLAIELYMVEPWERHIVHTVFAVVFMLFWYFNMTIMRSCISQLRGTNSQDMKLML